MWCRKWFIVGDIPALLSSGNTHQCHRKELICKSKLNDFKPVQTTDHMIECCANFSSASTTTGYSYKKTVARSSSMLNRVLFIRASLFAGSTRRVIDRRQDCKEAWLVLELLMFCLFSQLLPSAYAKKIPVQHLRSENIDEVKRSRYWQVPSVRTFDFWTSRDL